MLRLVLAVIGFVAASDAGLAKSIYGVYSCKGEYIDETTSKVYATDKYVTLSIIKESQKYIVKSQEQNGPFNYSEWPITRLPDGTLGVPITSDLKGKPSAVIFSSSNRRVMVDANGVTFIGECTKIAPAVDPGPAPVPAPAQNQTPAPPPFDCQAGYRLLANPVADAFLKQAVLEKMRNRGCMQ
jgi:hypothetical protein